MGSEQKKKQTRSQAHSSCGFRDSFPLNSSTNPDGMDVQVKVFGSDAKVPVFRKETRACPWRWECIFSSDTSHAECLPDCEGPWQGAACKWVQKGEECIALLFIAQAGEMSAPRIGEWLGFAGDGDKVARVRAKLSVLAAHDVLAVAGYRPRRQEKWFRLGPNAPPIIVQCINRFRALQERAMAELAEIWKRFEDLAEVIRKMEGIVLPSDAPKG